MFAWLQVKAIPEEMEYYGKGPLLSAKELDIDLAWERARQMQRVCEEVLYKHRCQVLFPLPPLQRLRCTVSGCVCSKVAHGRMV